MAGTRSKLWRLPWIKRAKAGRKKIGAIPRTIDRRVTITFYNDIDPKACAWTQELIAAGLIPPGKVVCKSITEIIPDELNGYTQAHFFNGIAGWARALDLAGWPRTRPVWCASLPCQSFSCAGKGKGFDDDRGQLWFPFLRLVRECRPAIIFGEQVEAAIRYGWLDRIFTDLENEGYSCGSGVLPAAGIGAPHIRQRLFWVADSERNGRRADESGRGQERRTVNGGDSEAGGMGHASPDGCEVRAQLHAGDDGQRPAERCESCRLADSELRRHGNKSDSKTGCGEPVSSSADQRLANSPSETRPTPAAGEYGGMDNAASQRAIRQGTTEPGGNREKDRISVSSGFWSDAIWHQCRDGKARRIPLDAERVLQWMADGLPEGMDACRIASYGFPLAPKIEGRAGLLRGCGNAIVPQIAAEFVKAVMEII